MMKIKTKADGAAVASDIMTNMPFYIKLDEMSIDVHENDEGQIVIYKLFEDGGSSREAYPSKKFAQDTLSEYMFYIRKYWNKYAD